jgi:hypothetical protein
MRLSAGSWSACSVAWSPSQAFLTREDLRWGPWAGPEVLTAVRTHSGGSRIDVRGGTPTRSRSQRSAQRWRQRASRGPGFTPSIDLIARPGLQSEAGDPG